MAADWLIKVGLSKEQLRKDIADVKSTLKKELGVDVGGSGRGGSGGSRGGKLSADQKSRVAEETLLLRRQQDAIRLGRKKAFQERERGEKDYWRLHDKRRQESDIATHKELGKQFQARERGENEYFRIVRKRRMEEDQAAAREEGRRWQQREKGENDYYRLRRKRRMEEDQAAAARSGKLWTSGQNISRIESDYNDRSGLALGRGSDLSMFSSNPRIRLQQIKAELGAQNKLLNEQHRIGTQLGITDRQRSAYVRDTTERIRILSTEQQKLNKGFLGTGDHLKSIIAKVGLWISATSIVFGTLRGIQNAMREIAKVDFARAGIAKVIRGDTLDERLKSAATLTKASGPMAAAYGQNITDVLDQMQGYARLGKQVNEIMSLTNSSLLLQRAASVEAADSTRLLTAMMQQYGLSVQDVNLQVNMLNELENTTGAKTKEIAEGVARAGSMAKATSVDLAELNAMIAVLVETTGKSGSETGRGLRTVIARIYGDDAVKELHDVGVAVRAQNGQLKDATSVLSELRAKWVTLTDAQRQSLAETLAGKRQVDVLFGLMNRFDRVISAVTDQWMGFNSAIEEAALMQNTVQGQLERFKSLWQEIFAAGGGGISETMRDSLKNINDFISRLNSVAPEHLKLWIQLFSTMAGAFVGFKSGAALEGMVSTLKGLSSVGLAGGAGKAVGALAKNPWGLLAAAVVGGGAWFLSRKITHNQPDDPTTEINDIIQRMGLLKSDAERLNLDQINTLALTGATQGYAYNIEQAVKELKAIEESTMSAKEKQAEYNKVVARLEPEYEKVRKAAERMGDVGASKIKGLIALDDIMNASRQHGIELLIKNGSIAAVVHAQETELIKQKTVAQLQYDAAEKATYGGHLEHMRVAMKDAESIVKKRRAAVHGLETERSLLTRSQPGETADDVLAKTSRLVVLNRELEAAREWLTIAEAQQKEATRSYLDEKKTIDTPWWEKDPATKAMYNALMMQVNTTKSAHPELDPDAEEKAARAANLTFPRYANVSLTEVDGGQILDLTDYIKKMADLGIGMEQAIDMWAKQTTRLVKNSVSSIQQAYDTLTKDFPEVIKEYQNWEVKLAASAKAAGEAANKYGPDAELPAGIAPVYKNGQLVGGLPIIGVKSNAAIHHGTHSEGGTFDITGSALNATGRDWGAIARELADLGLIVAWRKKGDSGITNDHFHIADPRTSPNEAKRLLGQRDRGNKRIFLPTSMSIDGVAGGVRGDAAELESSLASRYNAQTRAAFNAWLADLEKNKPDAYRAIVALIGKRKGMEELGDSVKQFMGITIDGVLTSIADLLIKFGADNKLNDKMGEEAQKDLIQFATESKQWNDAVADLIENMSKKVLTKEQISELKKRVDDLKEKVPQIEGMAGNIYGGKLGTMDVVDQMISSAEVFASAIEVNAQLVEQWNKWTEGQGITRDGVTGRTLSTARTFLALLPNMIGETNIDQARKMVNLDTFDMTDTDSIAKVAGAAQRLWGNNQLLKDALARVARNELNEDDPMIRDLYSRIEADALLVGGIGRQQTIGGFGRQSLSGVANETSFEKLRRLRGNASRMSAYATQHGGTAEQYDQIAQIQAEIQATAAEIAKASFEDTLKGFEEWASDIDSQNKLALLKSGKYGFDAEQYEQELQRQGLLDRIGGVQLLLNTEMAKGLFGVSTDDSYVGRLRGLFNDLSDQLGLMDATIAYKAGELAEKFGRMRMGLESGNLDWIPDELGGAELRANRDRVSMRGLTDRARVAAEIRAKRGEEWLSKSMDPQFAGRQNDFNAMTERMISDALGEYDYQGSDALGKTNKGIRRDLKHQTQLMGLMGRSDFQAFALQSWIDFNRRKFDIEEEYRQKGWEGTKEYLDHIALLEAQTTLEIEKNWRERVQNAEKIYQDGLVNFLKDFRDIGAVFHKLSGEVIDTAIRNLVENWKPLRSITSAAGRYKVSAEERQRNVLAGIQGAASLTPVGSRGNPMAVIDVGGSFHGGATSAVGGGSSAMTRMFGGSASGGQSNAMDRMFAGSGRIGSPYGSSQHQQAMMAQLFGDGQRGPGLHNLGGTSTLNQILAAAGLLEGGYAAGQQGDILGMLSGGLSGAATGLGLGLGPWGAAIGGGLSLVSGLVGMLFGGKHRNPPRQSEPVNLPTTADVMFANPVSMPRSAFLGGRAGGGTGNTTTIQGDINLSFPSVRDANTAQIAAKAFTAAMSDNAADLRLASRRVMVDR